MGAQGRGSRHSACAARPAIQGCCCQAHATAARRSEAACHGRLHTARQGASLAR